MTKKIWKPAVLILAVLTMLILAHVYELGDQLGALKNWIQGMGVWGPVVFILIYAGAAIAAIPGSALTLAAGALFGSVRGVIIVSVAATLGASLCFLISRYLARDAIAEWLSRQEKFRKLDDLTREHGAIIVALTRLTPIFPFNLLNYGFGVTQVSFWTYVFWSWLGMLPGTVLYVVGVDAVTTALTQDAVPWGLIGAAAGAAALLGFLIYYVRGKLKKKSGGKTAS
ncbi:MAG: TVP38/TMEM64 family protein [Acidobacteriota bacterium]